MTSAMRQFHWLKAFLLTGLMSVLSMLILQAQDPTFLPKLAPRIDDNINGFWEYLPRNYSTDVTVKYPLLIFIHGFGDSGDSPDLPTLNRVLASGLPKLIRKGNFPESFTVGGAGYRFIVLCPQIKNGLLNETSIVAPSTIEALLTYAKSNYRVDLTRIYMCGLSMGGGVTWDYAASSKAAANQLAAVAIAAGASDLTTEKAAVIAESNLPVLTTHNTVDNIIFASRTVSNISKLKAYTPAMSPSPAAFYWNSPGQTDSIEDLHNVWSRTFEDMQPKSTKGGNLVDSIGTSVYEWMLQFKRNNNSLPVAWESFNLQKTGDGVLVQWSTAKEISVRNYVVERSADGAGWSAIATIVPATGANSSKSYTFTDPSPYPDVCYYRIRVVNLNGEDTFSTVKQISTGTVAARVGMFPNPFTQQVTLNFPRTGITGNVVVKLINGAGAVVKELQYVVQPGGGDLPLQDLGALSNGVYYITIQNDKGKTIQRQKVLKR